MPGTSQSTKYLGDVAPPAPGPRGGELLGGCQVQYITRIRITIRIRVGGIGTPQTVSEVVTQYVSCLSPPPGPPSFFPSTLPSGALKRPPALPANLFASSPAFVQCLGGSQLRRAKGPALEARNTRNEIVAGNKGHKQCSEPCPPPPVREQRPGQSNSGGCFRPILGLLVLLSQRWGGAAGT